MQLDQFPRVQLSQFPTPLEELLRLRAHEGGPRLFIKRDDIGTLGLGGNKLRKLEYALAEALAQKATVVITSGAIQSNHVRLTLAACNRLGLRCEIVLRGDRPPTPTGNLLLDGILGPAAVHLVESTGLTREELLRETEAKVAAVEEALRGRGERPFVIPNGCAPLHGALGYAACVREIVEQMRAFGAEPHAIVTAYGTGSTYLGLLLGSLLFTGGTTRVIGISIASSRQADEARLRRNFPEVIRQLGLGTLTLPDHVEIYDDYLGPGYAQPTPPMKEAVLLLARREGILLDPVYTGKAMAGLLDLVRRGAFRPEENVVFLHTGGLPALFADTQAPTFQDLM